MDSGGSSPRVRGTLSLKLPVHLTDRFIPARAGNSARWRPIDRKSAVHPRACGELHFTEVTLQCSFGSSPRVRGTLSVTSCRVGFGRFIPARAGNSQLWSRRARVPPVHPRACGELLDEAASTQAVDGSSPRVRGTPRRGCQHAGRRRFIPARAGNSRRQRGSVWSRTVHPRACGELNADMESRGEWTGSSPRVRGTRIDRARLRHGTRFIPARAGNSVKPSRCGRWVSVHPRACGELSSATWIRVVSYGSSPRVRGTPPADLREAVPTRFIPARAGNSVGAGNISASSTVHPRACGELYALTLSGHCGTGSSPRVRGTPHDKESVVRDGRFIPARAGNSSAPSTGLCSRTVHPRACGELHQAGSERHLVIGSSPRVRGTL